MARLQSALLAAAAVLACPALAARQLSVRTHAPAPKQARSADVVAPNVLALTRTRTTARSAAYVSSLRSSLAPPPGSGYGATTLENVHSEEYVADIEWDGVPVRVVVDTGSSDTWLVQAGFTCVDGNGTVQADAECAFGPVFNGTFSGGTIPDQNFKIEYGDGRLVTGALGYEDVTVAGITVQDQQVALVNNSYWFGDSTTSGFMGLAYAYLTSAYQGTNVSADTVETEIKYDPIITTMIKQKLIDPVFSLALKRNSDSGYLALGGLPPVEYTGSFTSTPILMLDIFDDGFNDSVMATQYSFYTIIADAYIYEGSEKGTKVNTESWNGLFSNATVNTTQFPVIVDSGTLLMYLPTELYNDIIALYDPPAVYIDDQFATYAPCNASVPSLGVQINGTIFHISEADMLMQGSRDPTGEYCLIGPQDGTTGPYILGDTFMNNVISVFDVGASEMRFVAHDY